MQVYHSYKLIKSEELNHHGTLFAGRTAEIFVESGFIAAGMEVGNPNQIFLVKIHSMTFTKPVPKGDLIHMQSRVVALGKSSLTVYITISSILGFTPVEGFITYVNVGPDGVKLPHGLTLDPTEDPVELELRKQAAALR